MKTAWMHGSCYEPIPAPHAPVSIRRRKIKRAFYTLAVMAIVVGALAGLGWIN